MIAEVIINRTAKKLNRTFDYGIPEQIKDLIFIGSKVLVPFGNSGNLEEAFVIGIKEKSEYKVKDIARLEENLTEEQIELARWMANKYFCNVSECIKLMLTPGTKSKNKEKRIQSKYINVVRTLNKNKEELKSEKQIKILNFVEKNQEVTISEIEKFTQCSRAIVNTLIKNGYLEVIKKKVERNPLLFKKIEKSNNFVLNDEQKNAYNEVENSINNNSFKQFLLYGITGSRKNRNIYAIN